jgi:hypothetical protein
MVNAVASSSPSGGRSLRVNGALVNWDEALGVVLGYAFGTIDLPWKPEPSSVGPAVEGGVPRWAYRTYDCVPPSEGCKLTDIDILVPNAINARMGGAVIAGLHAVSAELSKEFAALDELGRAFWELDERDVLEQPADGAGPWPLWRAWSIVEGVPGSGIAVTDKVLHHKRPSIFPLLDNKTYAELGSPPDPWRHIHQDLTATAQAWQELDRAFAEAATNRQGVPVTRLRLHDILLWAQAVGAWDDCRGASPQ